MAEAEKFDIIVIGAGPAGVSAAVYARSRGKSVLVLEQDHVGGTIANVSTVTHYAAIVEAETGATFAARLAAQLEDCGAELRFEQVTGVALDGEVKRVQTAQAAYEAGAVIIANGGTPRMLGIPGEAELAGRGIRMNAARDAEKYAGRHVYVIGGSDGAAKEAIFLAKTAAQVTIVCVEDSLVCIDQFKSVIEAADNIDVIPSAQLASVRGDDHVTGFELVSVADGSPVKSVEDDGCGIFVYAGSTPNTQLYEGLDCEGGYLVVDEKMQTKLPGVYAAGDIRAKQVRQVATAVSDGAIAGINAAAYLG